MKPNLNAKTYYRDYPMFANSGQEQRRLLMHWTMDEWLDELDYLVDSSPACYWSSNTLGSPKEDNGIAAYYEEGLSPIEALICWEVFDGDVDAFNALYKRESFKKTTLKHT